jgi:hypothetical protein
MLWKRSKQKWWMKGERNANCGRMVENEIWGNYWFILLTRASHFWSVSKTVSIPEDLDRRCNWRTCCSICGILDALKKIWQKILSCAGLPILTNTFQISFSRFWSLFLEHSEDGPHTLLNGGLRRIPITFTWN